MVFFKHGFINKTSNFDNVSNQNHVEKMAGPKLTITTHVLFLLYSKQMTHVLLIRTYNFKSIQPQKGHQQMQDIFPAKSTQQSTKHSSQEINIEDLFRREKNTVDDPFYMKQPKTNTIGLDCRRSKNHKTIDSGFYRLSYDLKDRL